MTDKFKAKLSREITRNRNKTEFYKVMKKDKLETSVDIVAFSKGLPKNAKEMAVLFLIKGFAALGYSPTEIINKLEPKK